jgi:hypothetical protein
MFTVGPSLWGAENQASVLLLHMDGTSGSTTFVDSSPSAKTMTAVGNANVSTASPKFGTGAAVFDGTGDWIETASGLADFAFGLGDFTVECWVKTLATRPAIVDFYTTGNAGSWQLAIGFSSFSHLEWVVGSAGSAITLLSGATAISDNAWHHVAACRSSGITKLFVDGVIDASALDTKDYSGGVAKLAIGAQVSTRNTTYDMNGQIDEVRITRAARYTSAFTPSGPFPDA